MHRPRTKRQRGQGMTEYAIIIAVVAVLSIGIIAKFGNQIRAIITASTGHLTGEENPQLQSFAGEDPEKGLTDL